MAQTSLNRTSTDTVYCKSGAGRSRRFSIAGIWLLTALGLALKAGQHLI